MPIYVGKGVPGQPGYECKEFSGFPVSRDGKRWGNGPVDKDGFLIEWKDSVKPQFKHRSKYHK